MSNKKLLKMLESIDSSNYEPDSRRILLIDALNLFFRNFSMINMVNQNGEHIGGLGGFFRSLGAMIRQTDANEVYVVFDGKGSTVSRKNLLPEYKSGRNIQRVNWDVFDTLEEEDESKFNQIIRIIQYLKTLPVKTVSLERSEADDIIAYLSNILSVDSQNKVFIVSSDQDFLQLVSDNVFVYRPMEKKFYSKLEMQSKFGMPAQNYIIYKTLLGDNSDKIIGIRGLGHKKLLKLFPEITTTPLTLQDVIDISVEKFKEHILYARILDDIKLLETNYTVMNLSNPMIDEEGKLQIKAVSETNDLQYFPKEFIKLYDEDQMGRMIKNLEYWLDENFKKLLK
jgi:5'-3' exonuclease